MAHLGMNKDDSRYLEFTMNVTVDFKFQNFNLPLLNIHNQCGYDNQLNLPLSSSRIFVRTIFDHQKFQPMAPYPTALERQPDMSEIPPKQSWKEAASLIILAPDNKQKMNNICP
ncbi:hypothetical protein DERF_013226 [Dermatophagoides farinae]|uniref:Uncharacterized protein n=1 Tax=Dermatophagoides farinae TaxID=6954 RepID=A0A922L096_DERFA|nr:hypothetical protein DERF_013226 [Dermatophagoides farinae]